MATKKTTTKATEVKEVKAAVVEEAPKAEVKKAPAKKAATTKTTTAKTTTKAATTKKTATKKETVITIQHQGNEVTVAPRTQHRTVLHFTFYFLPFMPLRSQFRVMSTILVTEYEILCKRLLHALYLPGYRTSSRFCHLII